MKYVIEKYRDRILSVLLGPDGRAVEIHADQPEDGLKLGDIVVGRVERVAPGTGACFVEVAPGVKGYLPFEEMTDPIYTKKGASPRVQQGDELVVQVSREAFGSKDMSLSAKLELSGRYLVLEKCGIGLGISRKISRLRREDLKENLFSRDMLDKLRQTVGECGIIVRTNAEGAVVCPESTASGRKGDQAGAGGSSCGREGDPAGAGGSSCGRKGGPAGAGGSSCGRKGDPAGSCSPASGKEILSPGAVQSWRILDVEIHKELMSLAQSLQHIQLTAPYRPAFSVLLRQPDRWLKRTDSLNAESTEAILTDDKELYDKLSDYLPSPLSDRLRFYQDDMISMHNLFSLTRELMEALSRRVSLRSGANLVIEQTEALVSIDVNSSHSVREKDKEKAALKVNLEAADECMRQIRLRNLSGMILVDFINMEEDASYDLLMHRLRRAAAEDPMRVRVVDRTGLGLVEMTRRKVEAPLWQTLQDR